jgi:tetratricopeptide (TPR) repeat protein
MMVSEQNILFYSPIYESGKNQFKKNLQEILSKAKRANVPVLISDLVSNIKNQAPFVSKKTNKFPPASEIFQNAKNFEEQNLFSKAKANYYLAKDLDALRFRASEEFNDIIKEVCQEYGMFLVPMQLYFENASSHNLIGENLMLEHLHPNIKGYFLMTECFFETMKKYHLISEIWNESKIKISKDYRDGWGLTELDSIYGDMRIRILKSGWPFKPKSGINNFLSVFTPNSEVENLALRIWTDNSFTLEHGHVELAEYYEKNKEYDKAFKEYQALMCLTPLNNSPFLRAADLLIKSGQLSSALPILYKSLKLEQTVFANKWIGQILLNDNKVKEAIPYLEKAYNNSKNDPQLLYNLSGAYALNSQYREAKSILNVLYEVNPRFPGADLLKSQLDKILTKQN